MVSFERGNFEGGIPSHIINVSGADEEFKQKLIKEQEPSLQEIDVYVNALIEKIKVLAREKEKVSLIKSMVQTGDVFHITELQDQPTTVVIEQLVEQTDIWNDPALNDSNRYEYLKKIERVRKKVAELLKNKLQQDSELSYLTEEDVHHLSHKTGVGEYLTQVVNLKDEQYFLRKNRLEEFVRRPEDLQTHLQALSRLINLPPHENILNFSRYSPEDQKGVVKKVQLGIFQEYLITKPSLKNILFEVKIIRDCMKGASFLAEHDLVLEDISPDNLGYIQDEEHNTIGVLFDLEGIYLAGKEKLGRASKIIKETKDAPAKYPYYPPEASHLKPTEFLPAEMVFQFGKCLEKVCQGESFQAFKSNPTFRQLDLEMNTLVAAMVVYDETDAHPTKKRITLSQAIANTERIIAQLEERTS